MNNALPFGFGFFTNDNTPIDAKYYRNFNSSVLGAIHEPYNDVNDVNSSIISSIRYKGLTVAVKNGATSIDEYWYRDGILDGNLVLKGGLISITLNVVDFQALLGIYQSSTTYVITDADVSLYGGNEIYLTTNNKGKLNERGIGKFFNPKYDQTVAGFNVWTNLSSFVATPTSGTWTPQYPPENIFALNTTATGKLFTTINGTKFIPLTGDWSIVTSIQGETTGAQASISGVVLKSYTDGDLVHWGGKTWERDGTVTNGIVGTASDIRTLSADWIEIPFDEIEYNVAYDEIKYDVENDLIVYRNEKNSNVVSTNKGFNDEGWNPIKDFMWGNVYSEPNYKGIGSQTITNSYNENLNFRGQYQLCLTFENYSYQQNLTFENNSIQYNLTFENNSYQQYLTFDNNSSQENLTFDNNSSQQYLTFENNSSQENLTFDNSSYQNNLTFENYSYQQYLTFDNNSYQENLTFDNSSQQYLTFDNSTQENLTEITGKNQNRISFNNYYYDRTSSPMLANETYLEFKGNLPTITSLNSTTDKIYVKQDNQVKEIATSDLQILIGGGSSESLSQIIAGEDLLAGELVYLNTIDYKWYKADNLIETKIKGLIRIVKDNILTDDTGDAYNLGKVNLYTGLNIGSKYYIGSNGSIVDTLPITEGIFSRFVGVASSATELEFLLDESYYEMTLNDPSIIKIDESIASVMAGEALLAGDIIYLNTDNKWYKADNTIESKIKGLIRVAKDDSVVDALVDAYIFGSVNSYTGLVVGSNYYISTNGSISDTIPNIDGIFSRFIGVASSSTVLEFSDSGTYYEMTTSGGVGNVIDINVVDFQALLGVYSPSTTYKISDADFNLYGGTEVYLTTNGEGLLNERGLGKFYNPKYDQTVAGFNVWTNLSSFVATPTSGTWTPQYPPENIFALNTTATGKLFTTINGTKFIPLTGDWSIVTSIQGETTGAQASISGVVLKSYNNGDLVHWGGKTWERDGTVTNGLVGTATDIYNLSGGWTPILFDSVNYNVVYDEIKYDSLNDLIVYRNEQNNNIVSMSKDYAGYYGIGYNPIKAFMWGNTLINGIDVGIGSQIITNSYNENINFRGLYQSYLNLNNGSYQKNIIFDNGSFQQNLTFNSVSYQENLTFDNSSGQGNLTFENGSGQSYLTIENGSGQVNLTFENSSAQSYLTFENGSAQQYLTFENGSAQQYLTFENGSFQSNLTFDNNSFQNYLTFDNSSQSNLTFENGSAQQYLTFENNSTQSNLTFENGSSQDYLTEISGRSQTTISFNNYYYDRTSSPMLANETNLEFKGDLPTITTLNSTTDKIYVKQDNQVKEITTTDLQALIGGGGIGSTTETLTVSAFQALNGVYSPSTTYKISDADFNLYGGTEVYLTTNGEGLLNERGLGKFYNPKYDQTVAGFNVWTNLSSFVATPTSGTWTPQYPPENIFALNTTATGKLFTTINGTKFIPLTGDWSIVTSIQGETTGAQASISGVVLKSYNNGDLVNWGGKTWTRNVDSVNGLVGIADDIYTLSGGWTLIPFIGNETEYNIVYDEIIYDVENDVIVYRNEQNNNIVSTNKGYIDGGWNPIKAFMWGNVYSDQNYKGIGLQTITNSYNENLNFRGSAQYYLTFENNSSQYNLTFENNSSQENLTFENYSYQNNLTFENSSAQYNLTFENYSYQNNLTFENSSSQENLTFDNSSYQENLTFENNSTQYNLTFDNSSQQYLTEITGKNQNRISFNNYYYDRTSSPMLANETNLEFKGDLPTITTLNSTTDKIYVKQDNQVKEITTTDLQALIGGGGSGNTNLSYTATGSNGTVLSDTGNDAIIPLATSSLAGLLSPSEKTILSNTSNTNSGDETTTTILTKIGNGSLISSTYLPSYVDDVLEFTNQASFPVSGETGKIYIDQTSNLTYRWSGSAYIQVGGSSIILTTTGTGGAATLISSTLNIPQYQTQLSGTTDRISIVSNIVDISSNYIGQTSITTVGTLTTGSIGAGFGQIYLTNSIRQLPTEISTNTTLLVTHRVIYVDCTSNNVTLTLPVTTGNFQYIEYEIKRVDTNNVNTCTITTSAGTVFINNVTDTSITLDIGFKTTIRNRNATQWQTF